jgi:predicted RNA binding protein YcfA (HicA-like mRNA interferase family)
LGRKITPIHFKKLAKIFELEGFVQAREEGDHMVFLKNGMKRPVVIPKYSELPVFVIKNNLRTAGISRDKYFELLDKV